MVQAEASGKTCFDIGEVQPIDAERAGGGSMISSNFPLIVSCVDGIHTPPNPLYLRGGTDFRNLNP